MKDSNIEQFYSELIQSVQEKTFLKLTLSKYKGEDDLNNVYVKPVTIKNEEMLSFIYRYATKDITKNYDKTQAVYTLKQLLGSTFLNANLFTQTHMIEFMKSSKGATKLQKKKSVVTNRLSPDHNKQKHYVINSDATFLQELGITTREGTVKADMYDKFRQINKFIEIVDSTYTNSDLKQKERITVADFGSGKSYLTFAIYYYFSVIQQKKVQVIGVEVRKDMVSLSNTIAKKLDYSELSFIESTIQEYMATSIDVVVALHACDTATDDAIAKAIASHAQLVFLAPCCHKYVRKHMSSPDNLQEILKHGILNQRQADILTDGLRALTLEYFGYKTQVIEFISQEYTSKNLMITGIQKQRSKNATKLHIARNIMKEYSLQDFYLDSILMKKGLM